MRMKRLLAVAALALAACGGVDTSEDGSDLSVAACKDTWKSYAGNFFKTRCAACHARQLDTPAKVKASGARAAIASRRMPRDKALTAAQKKRILAWFSCGAR